VGKKKRDKHDFELAQSFIEVQDAYEMLTHSLQCIALVSGMGKKRKGGEKKIKLQIDTVSSENLTLQLDSCHIWVSLKKVICTQLLT